jgi:peptidyl-prolyl cis-trans isomerase D
MFDFVGRHKRLIQVILFLVFLPFAFFGIDSYFRGTGASQMVARVGDYRISQPEFAQALRERQQAIQRIAQGSVDPATLDSPELRYATLESLIHRRLLLERVLRGGMTIGDAQLQTIISELPLFQDEANRFSFTRYQQYLKSEGMTPVMFEARLRQDLMLDQLKHGYVDSNFVPRTVTGRLARLFEQQREVSHYTIAPDKFAGQVKLEAGAVKNYYDASPDEFQIPEQVRIEYLTLSLGSLMSQIQVGPEEIRKYYESHRAQFEVKEVRQASHILVSVEPGAGADAKQKARAKAEDIYRQLRQKPGSFAELAKRHSQDPGSAAMGGDLGQISRGTMKDVPEFEDALFKLKPEEISPPVESALGFHIIQANAVKPGEVKSLDEVRGQIENELKKQLAGRKFAETADGFNNIVYEQSESLKPAADLIKAVPQQSGWITRAGTDNALLSNPKLLQAVFSEEVLKNKRNTEAIEVAPNTLVAARVVEHKPATLQPFEEVRASIEKKLRLREAGKLAAQEGRNLLEQLKQGKGGQVAWSAPHLVSRAEHKDLAEPVVRQAFRLDVGKPPAYTGFENPQGGYTLLRVMRVVDPENIPAEKRKAYADALREVLGQEEFGVYLMSLKQKAEVTISKEQIEKK